MAKHAPIAPGGYVYHVMNRAIARMPLFRKEADFEAFECVMEQAYELHPIRILDYCLMKDHFHFILWPKKEDELRAFMRWLTSTHTMRWHVAHNSIGRGHLYQGRFKSFPIQPNDHLITACRYVQRNPVRPGVVKRAQDWRWGSLWRRQHGTLEQQAILSDWPVPRPANWLKRVNAPATNEEFDTLRRSLTKSCPFGDPAWRDRTAAKIGLEHTLRNPGRPKATPE